MNDPVKEILRHLERISASGGQSNSNIFDDFLDISLATIESLPGHVKSAVKKETYIDTPETEKLFLDMHSRYTRSDQWDHSAMRMSGDTKRGIEESEGLQLIRIRG